MKLGIGLMAVGVALMAFGLQFLTTGAGCVAPECHPGPSINEISFDLGVVVFLLGFARSAYVAWRSRAVWSRIFVVLIGVTFVAAILVLFFPGYQPPNPERNLPDLNGAAPTRGDAARGITDGMVIAARTGLRG